MQFKQFFDDATSTYTYFLIDSKTLQVAIIDPVLDHLATYLKELKQNSWQLLYVLDTHVHADHITASGELKNITGAQVVMSEKTQANCVDLKLKDCESITLGDLTITCLHTPGHTDDSCCFLLDDRVFTGDTLLINATGRTDFQNGSAEKSYASIFNKLLILPDETLVYPAHDYNGKMVSTIGQEKRFNPRLQVKSCDEYINLMDNLNLPKPKQIDVAVPANINCGLDV